MAGREKKRTTRLRLFFFSFFFIFLVLFAVSLVLTLAPLEQLNHLSEQTHTVASSFGELRTANDDYLLVGQR